MIHSSIKFIAYYFLILCFCGTTSVYAQVSSGGPPPPPKPPQGNGEPQPECGDGAVDDGEACDDGGANGTLASMCNPDCTFKPPEDGGPKFNTGGVETGGSSVQVPPIPPEPPVGGSGQSTLPDITAIDWGSPCDGPTFSPTGYTMQSPISQWSAPSSNNSSTPPVQTAGFGGNAEDYLTAAAIGIGAGYGLKTLVDKYRQRKPTPSNVFRRIKDWWKNRKCNASTGRSPTVRAAGSEPRSSVPPRKPKVLAPTRNSDIPGTPDYEWKRPPAGSGYTYKQYVHLQQQMYKRASKGGGIIIEDGENAWKQIESILVDSNGKILKFDVHFNESVPEGAVRLIVGRNWYPENYSGPRAPSQLDIKSMIPVFNRYGLSKEARVNIINTLEDLWTR